MGQVVAFVFLCLSLARGIDIDSRLELAWVGILEKSGSFSAASAVCDSVTSVRSGLAHTLRGSPAHRPARAYLPGLPPPPPAGAAATAPNPKAPKLRATIAKG